MARILVIDDNLTYVELLRDYFEGRGHEILALNDSTKAFEVAKAYEPHLVVLDIRMPISGRNILLMLKECRPRLPIIIYSAYSSYRNDPDFARADAFVVKSPNLKELAEAIESITLNSSPIREDLNPKLARMETS